MRPAGWASRRSLILGLWVTALIATSVPTQAAKKEQWGPRSIALRTSFVRQPGKMQWVEWSNLSGNYCSTLHADGIGGFPKAATHQPGDSVKIRLVKRRKPVDASVTGWRAVDENGHEIGPAEEIPITMERHHDSEGKTKAWHLVFTPTGVGDLYLRAFAEWDDSCDIRHGLWSFHISTAEVPPPS